MKVYLRTPIRLSRHSEGTPTETKQKKEYTQGLKKVKINRRHLDYNAYIKFPPSFEQYPGTPNTGNGPLSLFVVFSSSKSSRSNYCLTVGLLLHPPLQFRRGTPQNLTRKIPLKPSSPPTPRLLHFPLQ